MACRMKRCLLFLAMAAQLTGAGFPEPYNSEPGDPAPTPAEESLRAISLPPGFVSTLFASEPEVQNPIAMSWDARGRLWVAENFTYAERAKRFDLALKDRVIVLEDADWDGGAEMRTVFTEDVQMLTSIEIGRGGVWLMCPPQVLFIPDADHDAVPDGPARVMLDGFTVARDNYHNFANGLRLAADGWLYGRCGHSCPGRLGVPGTPDEKRVPIKGGIWRFHPEKKIVEVLTHGTTNPWGHDWDRNGEMFFINTVTGHLWHLIHGAHLVDSNVTNPLIYERLDTIADHYHYDRKGSWSDSRGGKASDLGGGHAHIGMMIYQADQWPEPFRNKLFTLNMHGRRTNVERLERNGSGYVGRHEPDIFVSSDPWFRGLEINTGPDGSGFILDWSDIGECHESTGVHRTSGRIYRMSHGTPARPAQPFAWRKPWPAADICSRDEHSRVLGIREKAQFWPLDLITGEQHPQAITAFNGTDAGVWNHLLAMAREDPSALVRLNLASVLQRAPVQRRGELALALLSHGEDADDPFLPSMVWFGISPLAKAEPQSLVAIARECRWPKTLRWITRSLAPDAARLDELLAKARPEQIEPVIEGMADAFKGVRKAPKPARWEEIARSPAAVRLSERTRELSVVFGDGRALDEVRRIALDSEADISARESALKTLIEARPPDLRAVCTQLLEARNLNATAARGLALFDDPEIGRSLAASYRKFQPSDRAAVMDVLASRPAFAASLLREMAAGKIPRSELGAFHARQIRAFNDENLSRLLAEAWGELRESGADKKALIERTKSQLPPAALAKADLQRGRSFFTALCASCHALYGEGGRIGPDLTGSGRANLDYLLENILDPSGVVSADFRMSALTLHDGRVLSGVIAGQTSRAVTLRTLTEELTLPSDQIEKTETSPLSMMPEGLLLPLQPDQVRDLIGYLMHPTQVPMPAAK